MEEREDTELLRELLPRFISSCSVWRLQLSVLNEFILYDRTEVVWIIYWVGWQSSYRISHNNNLKLHQYWQNTVLNGSYSKQTSHFDSSFLAFVVSSDLWVSYLVLAEPHCSFLTNISFSLICFLFPLHNCHFAPLSRGQCEPARSQDISDKPPPGTDICPPEPPARLVVGDYFLSGQVRPCQARPLPNLPCLVPPAVIAAGRGLPWMLPVGSTGNIEQQQVWR